MSDYLTSLAPADMVALGILVLNAVLGLAKGFAHQLTRLVVLIGSLVAGRYLADDLAPIISERVPDLQSPGDQIAAYFTIFFGVLLAGVTLGYLLRNLIKALELESFDHLLGLVLGIVKGALIVIIAVLVAAHLIRFDAVEKTIRGTESLRLTRAVVEHVTPLFPEPVRDDFLAWTSPAVKSESDGGGEGSSDK